MSEESRGAAVLYAKDMNRVCRFYEVVLGFAITRSQPDYVILESAGFELDVVAIPMSVAATIEIASPPSVREETPIKLVFYVESIDRARALGSTLGGGIYPCERERQYQSYLICDGIDPEGNVLQLRERLT